MTSVDIPLYGDDISVLIDWAGDGRFAHARSDVSDDWIQASFQFGTSRRSNPQRPTIQAGAGNLVLIGEQFVPGRSSVWTLDQLQARYRVRVSLGTVVLWEAWMDRPRHPASGNQAGLATSFELEGYLERPGRVHRMISQTATTVNSNATAVLNLLRNAYGLNASEFAADIDATPLQDYEWEGPAAEYGSLFSQVSGGLLCARRAGALRLQDPSNRPASVTAYRNTDYTVLRATTDLDIEQLWNKALIQYDGPETPGSGTARGSVSDPGAGGASGVTTDLTIANPASGVKVEDMAATLTVGAATGQWREVQGDPGSGNASGTVTDPGQSDLRGVDTNLTLNDPATGHVIEELDATLAVGAATGTWQELVGDPHSGTGAGSVSDPGAFGASGVRTNLVIANPDSNHRVEDMDAVLTLGAATASYTWDDRNISPSATQAAAAHGRSTVVRMSPTLRTGDRITDVTGATAVIPAAEDRPAVAFEVIDATGGGSALTVTVGAPTGNSSTDGTFIIYGGHTYTTSTLRSRTLLRRLSNGVFFWGEYSNGWAAATPAGNNITVTANAVVRNTTVYSLPAPTRRTAPSWEVERVSRSQDPNNRNQSLARVTLVGTDQPGTWRLNDSGTNVDVSAWEHSAGGKTYRLGSIAVSFAITWRLRDTRTHTVTPTRQASPNWTVDRVSRSTDPTDRNRKFVRVTVADAHEPGTWRINDGTNTVDLTSWQRTTNNRLYRITGIAVTFAVSWRVRDTRTHTVTPTRRVAPNWDVDRVGLTDNPANANNRLVRITLGGTDAPGTWRINDGANTVDLTTWTRTAHRREYRILTIAVSFAVTWVLDDENVYMLEAQNDDSIRAWRERTLTFPVWFARTATAALKARIDELSKPRNIIVEDFAVRQPDATKTAAVANIQPGDHIGLITSEPSDRVNVNAVVMVMNVGYDLHRERQVSRKRIVCIEAGARVPDTFPPTFVSASTNAAGTEIVAVFDEKLDASSVPALSAFTIRAGTTRRLGSARSISGSEVKFAFGTAFAHVDVITIAYTKPDSDPLQDEAGNEVETFTAQPVTNNVSEPITGDGAPIRALGSLSRGLSRDRYGDGDPITVALTLDEARWALTVLAEAEPIAVAAALEDATGAELLETGSGEPIDATAGLPDASGNVLTFGRGSPIVAATMLEDDAAGTVVYLGTGEPIAASGTLEDATGDELLETGSGEPIDASAALTDASGRDIKPYPAPENARERTRIPFGRLFQVTFEWDAPTSPPRQGDLWQYEYQTRVQGRNWSSSSTVGSTTLVSGASTFTDTEEYEFRVRAVYVFNAQFFRSDWATYSSNVEPTSGAGEPISISAALPEARERGPVTGLPPYALTLNDRALALNDHVLTLPPPSV